MKTRHILLAAMFFAAPLIVIADYAVNCEAYNTDTSADVTGKCTDGKFEGIDSETGKTVLGDCEDYGEVSAYDSETGEYVYGECEGA